MSIYSASTLSVNLTTGVVTQSDPILIRDSCAVTLTGTGSHVNSNMKLALYRWLKSTGTLVGTVNTFTGALDNFGGSLNLNVTPIITVFETNLHGIRQFEKADFDLYIYDASQTFYLVQEKISVSYQNALGTGTPGSVDPITAATTSWGDLKLYGGSLYKYNVTDGLYYKWTAAGAGSQAHDVLDDVGIAL